MAVQGREQGVLLLHDVFEPGPEAHGVKELADPKAGPTYFVDESRADAPLCGADGPLAASFLLKPVKESMVRHYQVRPVTHQEVAHCHAMLLQLSYFLQQDGRVDYHPIADDASHVVIEDAGRYQVQPESAVRVDGGMTRIVTSCVAHYHVCPGCKGVDYLAFALISPLTSDKRDN